MTNKKLSVGILGAGISGLSVAYALAKKGINATVYEKNPEVGGAIKSVRQGDWLVEEGPNTLMIKSDALWDLLDYLGLSDQMVEANRIAKRRFVIKDGTPVAAPMSLKNLITTPLFSAKAKFQLLKEPFAAVSAHHDESIATFIKRRLGQQLLDYAVNPFVSGVYAGDPKSLSIKHTFSSLWEMEQKHGSLLKGLLNRNKSSAKRALISFKNGNQQLPKTMAKALPGELHTSTSVDAVRLDNKSWIVRCTNKDDQSFEHSHDSVISTVPAYALNNIFEGDRFQQMNSLPYAPMHMLAVGFKTGQIIHPLDGFGMLAPEVENLHFLGSLFSSTLFEARAPAGYHLLTCFIGGARQPELAKQSPEELQTILLNELHNLLGITGDPVFSHHRYWEKAIPQYVVGYDYFLSVMKEIEKQHPGLFIGGNFRGGVSVPDCISSGFETAHKVQTFLQSR